MSNPTQRSNLTLHGHEANLDRFRRALESGRLPSTFLFVGPSGIGKRTFAIRLAAALLCRDNAAVPIEPCGKCPDCLQVAAGSHPDLEQIAKPADKNFIPIELFIGDREHRGREGLCHRLALKPSRGRRKIAIVDDADYLNIEGANSLLKTLEEPPVGSVLILIATSLARQLPTIRSRCQIVRFHPLAENQIAELLIDQGVCSDCEAAASAAKTSQGSFETAVANLTGSLGEFRQKLRQILGAEILDSVALANVINKHVNDTGQDTAKRRQALRLVINAAADFYREQMLVSCGIPPDSAGQDFAAIAPGLGAGDGLAAATCLDRCLEAQVHLESNANLTTLIESWADAVRAARRTKD